MNGKTLTFFLRLGSTVGLWVFVLTGILSGYEIAFFLLIAGLGSLGLWEYFSMLKTAKIPCFPLAGMLSAAVFFVAAFFYFRSCNQGAGLDFELAAISAFVAVVFGRQMVKPIVGREPLESMAYTLLGLIYIPWLFAFLLKIVYLAPAHEGILSGQYYVLYLIVLTKFSDMGAYIFGVLFGKHPSVPHISPNKTWEGFAGAIFTAFLASWMMHAIAPEKLSLLRTIDLCALPLLIGGGAIIGDLAESVVKRSSQSKDSSHLLPGIGGTLDLIDSVLFTAPIFYFYMRFAMGVGS